MSLKVMSMKLYFEYDLNKGIKYISSGAYKDMFEVDSELCPITRFALYTKEGPNYNKFKSTDI